MKKIVAALVVSSFLALSSTVVLSAPCKDAKGKFVKCPPKVVVKAPAKRCRDTKGHFTKCTK